MSAKPLTFQEMIFNLETFWSEHGALIGHPYYSQVGAGTMNPATFLRVLGPEPWDVAYVEPSVRPDDGRYGINPNRVQQHHQFQVILKPDPGNPQDLYLQSLLALGIDPKVHDIRFVEDNWESPALSAWGLGWEVWLDGQEITQFTYFQQSGGMVLDVPSVELTYGLERIAMTLQRVKHFKDIQWSPKRTYGDVYLVAEREHSTYYYEVADVNRQKELWDAYVAEAALALERGLVLPAYDNVIKSSHTFNVLDARGAVGYTERMAMFARMRELSRKVSEAYLAQRAEMGFPWLVSQQAALDLETPAIPEPRKPNEDLLLEIGTEELPVADLDAALGQLRENGARLLKELRLDYASLDIEGTPRRLMLLARGLQTRQADREIEVKGPPAKNAFDAEGNPTPVAMGFAKARGVRVEDLSLDPSGTAVVARVHEQGKSAPELLAAALPELIKGLRFGKSMRWNASGQAFSRPVRWLVALLGDEVIPFGFAGLESGRSTRGLRFSQPAVKELQDSSAYLPFLKNEGIIVNQAVRRETVWRQALAVAEAAGGTLEKDPDLLAEVSNLVERPTALLGSFDLHYLENLPPEVLIGVMKKHQRYFPVLDAQGQLMPHFVIVRNGDETGAETVVDGNQQVILARFADAEFFVNEDKAHKLEDFVPRLAQLTFQKELGSMLDKSARLERLVSIFGPRLGLDPAGQGKAQRAAQLSKADLASAMVVEMTSLQGTMGRYYARLSGEDEAVAQALHGYYLPRTADDAVPQDKLSQVLGIADRLDSIAGLFAVGLQPTANKDPYALRRTALGLAQLLSAGGISFDLRAGLEAALAELPVAAKPDTLQAALDFIAGRLKGLLADQGFKYDVVEAVMAAKAEDPAAARANAELLSRWVESPAWADWLPAYSRCVRITRDLDQAYEVDSKLLVEPEEQALLEGVIAAEARLAAAPGFEAALEAVDGLVGRINAFFDAVLVMAPDPKLRESRLGLLQRVAGLVKPYAEISALEGF